MPWQWAAALSTTLLSLSFIVDAQHPFHQEEISRVLGRYLTDVDAEYNAPSQPVDASQRQQCSGFGQTEALKGEWVRHSETMPSFVFFTCTLGWRCCVSRYIAER